MSHSKKICIVGISGMLGSEMFKQSNLLKFKTLGISKNTKKLTGFKNIYLINDVFDNKCYEAIINFNPDFVINCVGIIKQRKNDSTYTESIKINSLWLLYLDIA